MKKSVPEKRQKTFRHAFLRQLGHGAVFVLLHSRGQKARLCAVDKCRTAEKQKEEPTAGPDKDTERQGPRRTGGCIDELLHQPGDYEVEHGPYQRPGSGQHKGQPVAAVKRPAQLAGDGISGHRTPPARGRSSAGHPSASGRSGRPGQRSLPDHR